MSSMKAIRHVDIVTEDRLLEDHVLVYDEKIQAILDSATFEVSKWKDICEVVDANDLTCGSSGNDSRLIVSPGLVDIHIHGYKGVDVMDADSGSLDLMAAELPSNGVTSFLATTMTMSWERVEDALANVRAWMEGNKKNTHTAEILGVHLEGPFISEAYKGAQDPQYILTPEFKLIEPWTDIIRLVTFAPESKGADIFIEEVNRYNKIVESMENARRLTLSIGHSAATYDVALEAYRNGVSHITHCFNAMSPLHHRAPGVVGAALAWPFTTEMICDTVHVEPTFYQGFINIKGKEKVVLVTDCMCAGGLEEGTYELGGQKVIVENGAPRLENGALAGSILKMDQGIRNLQRYADLDFVSLAAIGSLNPAKVIGFDDRKGSLKVGKDADFYLHTTGYEVVRTIGRGRLIHENQNCGKL